MFASAPLLSRKRAESTLFSSINRCSSVVPLLSTQSSDAPALTNFSAIYKNKTRWKLFYWSNRHVFKVWYIDIYWTECSAICLQQETCENHLTDWRAIYLQRDTRDNYFTDWRATYLQQDTCGNYFIPTCHLFTAGYMWELFHRLTRHLSNEIKRRPCFHLYLSSIPPPIYKLTLRNCFPTNYYPRSFKTSSSEYLTDRLKTMLPERFPVF